MNSTRSSLRTRWLMTAITALSAIILVSCGTDTPEAAPEPADSGNEAQPAEAPASDSTAAFPVTVGGIEIAARPERIVVLSPTSTEMLFAIGAGDQVVAVDEYSNYPSQAPTTDLSGFQPNVEAIAAYSPDLVVTMDDPGGIVASLAAIDIPTLALPAAATIDDTYQQLEQLGAATGNIAGAAAVVADMQAQIDGILSSVDLPGGSMTYFHELTPDYYTVTSQTFVGHVYQLLGLTSIADNLADGFDYPQLSPEFIIDADPDIIFLADAACCGITADDVPQRPGWDTISAVEQGLIVELDEDIASRWGPRIVEFLRKVADALHALEPAA